MSFSLPTLCEAVCIPSARAPIDTVTFLLHVLLNVLGYFVVATLAVTHGTRVLRLALWPVIVSLAWRAVVTVDSSTSDPSRKCFTMFVFSMIFIVTRTLDWSLTQAPLTRRACPTKGSRSIIMDGLDLAFTLRGHGWDWSGAVRIPRETRPSSREGFTIYVILSAIIHTLMHAVARKIIASFSPTGIGALYGGTIFDETLPPYVRYFRASVISAFAAFATYAIIQTSYDICTIIGVLVFGQDPAQWPPAFDAPWSATSLSDFWGRWWHQFFRRLFLVQGGYPLSFILGRAGLVIGSFLSSAMTHHITLLQLNAESEPWRMLVGFGMMAPVVLAEDVFRRTTGRKVGGWAGRVWTITWLLVLGNILFDGFARAGVYGNFVFAEGMVPGLAVVERMVVSFDCWLHTM